MKKVLTLGIILLLSASIFSVVVPRAVTFSPPYIVDVGISNEETSVCLQPPPSLKMTPQGHMRLWYSIHNPNAFDIDVILGASIGIGGNTYHDQPNDKLVTLQPGTSLSWPNRWFYVEAGVPEGSYTVYYGLWDVSMSVQYDQVSRADWINMVSSVSVQLASSPSNIGSITWDNAAHTLPTTVETTIRIHWGGSDDIHCTPPIGYQFHHWESSGEVDPWDEYSRWTNVDVDGGGSLAAFFVTTGLSDFMISVSPSSRLITNGESATYTVTVTSANSFNSPVTLSVSGLPEEATSSFAPSPVTPPPDGSVQSTLTIDTERTVQSGEYSLAVSGSGGGLARLSNSFGLTIGKHFYLSAYTEGTDPPEPWIIPRPITDPVGTSWFEIHPVYDLRYRLESWFDTNEDGELNASDQAIFDDGSFCHVESVVFILHWTYTDTPGGTEIGKGAAEYLTAPWAGDPRDIVLETYWHQIYPPEEYGSNFWIYAWQDNDDDWRLSPGDWILLYYSESKYAWATIDAFSTGLVVHTSPNDLLVLNVEPIQVVRNAEALIMNKKTVLRVEVLSTYFSTQYVTADISSDLGTPAIEVGIPVNRGLNTLYVPGGPVYYQDGSSHTWASSDFLYWTQAGTDNNIRVRIQPLLDETNLNNNEATTSAEIVESSPLSLYFVPVLFEGDPDFDYDGLASTMSEWLDLIRGIFPIADVSGYLPHSHIPSTSLERPDAQAMNALELENWLYENVVYPYSLDIHDTLHYDRAVFLIQDLDYFYPDDQGQTTVGSAIGMLRPSPYRIPIVIDPDHSGPATLAHELGHTYYLWHPVDIGPPTHFADCYWVAERNYREEMSNFMTNLGFGVWIDNGRYDSDPKIWISSHSTWRWNLFDQRLNPTGNVNANDPEVISVNGIMYMNGSIIARKPWYRTEGVPDLAPESSGNFSIVLLDSDSQILSRMYFNISFTYFIDWAGNLTRVQVDSMPFVLKTPYIAGTTQVQVWNSTDHVLISRGISPNSPLVSVINPNGGEDLTAGTDYQISWDGTDLDGDDLVYTLTCSADGGDSWIPIVTELSQTSFAWDTHYLSKGSSYLVKVIATDGVNMGEDVSDSTFTVRVHDVEAAEVTSSKIVVGEGFNATVDVTVRNIGDFTETFNVTAYANTTLIGKQEVTLNAGENTTVTFEWSTAGLAKGSYVLSAVADTVNLEFFTTDNTKTGDAVLVTIAGDINGDRAVNIHDIHSFGKVYNTAPIDPLWLAEADINDDLIIDAEDLHIINAHYGQSW